jgi:hypothetical protein
MKSGLNLLLSCVLIILLLPSCVSTKQDIESYFMENIQLNPESLDSRRVYVQFSNSTIFNEFDLKNNIVKKLENKNFQILESSKNSPIILSINIKSHGKLHKEIKPFELQDSFLKAENLNSYKIKNDTKNNNFSVNDFVFLTLGSVAGFVTFNNIGLALIMGTSSYYANKTIVDYKKNNKFITVVDVSISEISKETIKTYDFREVKQGAGGSRKFNFNSQTLFKQYQSRLIIISNGNQLNLVAQNIINSVSATI